MVEGEGEIPSWLLLIWMSLRWCWEVLKECDLTELEYKVRIEIESIAYLLGGPDDFPWPEDGKEVVE